MSVRFYLLYVFSFSINARIIPCEFLNFSYMSMGKLGNFQTLNYRPCIFPAISSRAIYVTIIRDTWIHPVAAQ